MMMISAHHPNPTQAPNRRGLGNLLLLRLLLRGLLSLCANHRHASDLDDRPRRVSREQTANDDAPVWDREASNRVAVNCPPKCPLRPAKYHGMGSARMLVPRLRNVDAWPPAALG